MKSINIDTSYDFQSDMNGKDSDRYSPKLQEYHRILWSKSLPNGKMFGLKKISQNRLYHKSELGEYFLSSDRAIPSFSSWKRLKNITSQIPSDKVENFIDLGNTIGGIVIWPSNKIDNLPTINASRGFNRKIADRLDLTIECIRLYYLGKSSPLYNDLTRYKSYFDLFDNFRGYIDFFLLQDFVSDDYISVKITHPFNSFEMSPVPSSVDEYVEYMTMTMKLIKARNRRIDKFYNG